MPKYLVTVRVVHSECWAVEADNEIVAKLDYYDTGMLLDDAILDVDVIDVEGDDE